jgi:uncharacterized protein YwqG
MPEKGDHMFHNKLKNDTEATLPCGELLKQLKRNEISVTTRPACPHAAPSRSKFGGRPAVPQDFRWPRFEAENYDGETANRPLSFLCQINLADVTAFDQEHLLPESGLLLFFYEQESMSWGFDPADRGCVRVLYYESTDGLAPADIPEDLGEDYRVKEYDLSFRVQESYPSYEELRCHVDAELDWDTYDEAIERDTTYNVDCERHKLLGYANLVQGEMLTECERVSRGLYCGTAESYRNTPEDVKADIRERASDWVLLFQMASICQEDYELMYGDMGNLYFYIRKQDLKNCNFDGAWFALQCG